ncbi:MAG: hypothetical protein AAGM38_18700 [Pseudomonadota bacterium]
MAAPQGGAPGLGDSDELLECRPRAMRAALERCGAEPARSEGCVTAPPDDGAPPRGRGARGGESGAATLASAWRETSLQALSSYEPAPLDDYLRARILAAPEAVLDDALVMRALLGPETKGDRQVIDLRGAQVVRLQDRLERLREAQHDLATETWEQLDGMARAQNAVLSLLEAGGPADFGAWVRDALPSVLNVSEARLCLRMAPEPARAPAGVRDEPSAARSDAAGSGPLRWIKRVASGPRAAARRRARLLAARLAAAEPPAEDAAARLSPAAMAAYAPRPPRRETPLFPVAAGHEARSARRAPELADSPLASIRIRDPDPFDRRVFGMEAGALGAVAVVALDLGPQRGPAALALGAEDAERFRMGYTIETLALVAGALERMMAARPDPF